MASFGDLFQKGQIFAHGGGENEASSQQRIFGPQAQFLSQQFIPELTRLFQRGPVTSPTELAGRETALNAANALTGNFLQPAQGALGTLFGAADPNSPLVQDAISAATEPLFRQFETRVAPAIRRSSSAAGQPGGSRGTIATRLAAEDLFRQAGDIGKSIALGAHQQGLGAVQAGLGLTPSIAGLSLLPSDVQRQIGAQESGEELSFLAQLRDLLGPPTVLGSSQSEGFNVRGVTQGFSDIFGGGAGGAMGAFSDRRLKRNIKKIGQLKNGLNVYRYIYVWGQAAIGVMADEVKKVIPDAVKTHSSGYDVVDYSRIV